MNMLCQRPRLDAALLLAFALIGFHSTAGFAANNVNVEAEQTRLRLAQPPGRAAPVLDVQKRLVAAARKRNAPKTADVVVSGQIGGMPNVWPETHPEFPWYRGQASIFLVDNQIAAQFAAHAKSHGGGHDCAFCKSLAGKNAHAIAVVNFVDEDGQILPIDARDLLNLKENQKVTIRGKAKLLAGRMLVIDADGIYAPR